MADPGSDTAQEAARLEAALDRIASAAKAPNRDTDTDQGRAALAGRLDALIAELRQVLGRDSAD